tara:strand:- start:6579 stop:7031 length:453 start_codon:yes stop_codon:yes gene_type:complete
MKNYKSMRGVSLDLAKLMAQSEKEIAVGNTQANARGDQLGRGGRVVKSADQIAREHYNQNNPRAVVKSSIKVDNVLDAGKPVQKQKQTEDDWVEPKTTPQTMSEREEYANAGISKEEAEKKAPETNDDWVEDEEGNFVRKSTTTKKKKGK